VKLVVPRAWLLRALIDQDAEQFRHCDVDGFTYSERVICAGDPDFIAVE
jgi:hypothetical protein